MEEHGTNGVSISKGFAKDLVAALASAPFRIEGLSLDEALSASAEAITLKAALREAIPPSEHPASDSVSDWSLQLRNMGHDWRLLKKKATLTPEMIWAGNSLMSADSKATAADIWRVMQEAA
jgi:hypothetical protein